MIADPAENREGWLESWTGLLRRRWPAGSAVFALILILTVAVIFLSRPVYRAQAMLRLGEPPPTSGVSPTAGFFGLMRLGGDPFANDMELMESRTLTENVIADASLNAQLQAPRGWHRDSLFTGFVAGPATERASYELAWRTDNSVTVRMRAPRDSMVTSGSAGRPLSFGGVTVVPRPLRAGMPATAHVRTVPVGLAVLEQAPRIIVERSSRDANVIDISYDATDPAVAEAVVASVIRRFIELRATIQRRESGQAVDSLRVVADSTNRELRDAESALEAWQRETRLVQPEIQGEAFMERYSALVLEAADARYELEAIVAISDRLDMAADAAPDWTLLLTYPRFLENETIGALLARRTGLEQQRAELATRRAATSREMRLIDQQVQDIDASLRSLVDQYRIALARRLDVVETNLADMDRSLAATPAQAIEMGRRQRAIRLLSEIILLTEQRLRQEELRQALTFSNVQVIDPPALRWKPVWPRRTLGLAVGLLLSGAFGLLGMVVAERADRTVRRGTDIEETIGAPILAVALARRGRSPSLSESEIRAIVQRAGAGSGAVAVRLAAAGAGARTVEIVQSLAASNGRLATTGEAAAGEGPLAALPPIEDFAAAAAAERGAVALVVRCGRTRRDTLVRSVRMLHDAGATVIGSIVVCETERQRSALWH